MTTRVLWQAEMTAVILQREVEARYQTKTELSWIVTMMIIMTETKSRRTGVLTEGFITTIMTVNNAITPELPMKTYATGEFVILALAVLLIFPVGAVYHTITQEMIVKAATITRKSTIWTSFV